ncbi:hypothetical protein ACQR1I_24795 [Bradyrhizobium sp. HKCCYLS2038]|uniref:hypothetical protein n=1 Tax=Bradyrhizobium sp. HKCCYLRH3095 TaxID=3420765 RepID=UPI003EB9FBA4
MHGLVLTIALLMIGSARAQVDTSAQNLMVVVREAIGANQNSETLEPLGRGRLKLSDGREFEFELAAFLLLGDMQIRFVFDGPQFMSNAKPQDRARLGLAPAEALALAVANIKRVYGDPVAKPWEMGLMQVEGRSPDLDSSYVLDRAFWRHLLREHPEGLVVAVPKRGALLFTPANEEAKVQWLPDNIARLHATSGKLRVSSALYLFKDDRWTVFQSPRSE